MSARYRNREAFDHRTCFSRVEAWVMVPTQTFAVKLLAGRMKGEEMNVVSGEGDEMRSRCFDHFSFFSPLLLCVTPVCVFRESLIF